MKRRRFSLSIALVPTDSLDDEALRWANEVKGELLAVIQWARVSSNGLVLWVIAANNNKLRPIWGKK